MCHIQQHTRWQCVPLSVIFNSMRDDSVCLCMLFSISYKMAAGVLSLYVIFNSIQDGYVCLSVLLFSIMQYDNVCQSMSHSTSYNMAVCTSLCHIQQHARWQCFVCLLYSTAYKMPEFASLCNYSTSCKVTVLASLCLIRHDIT